MNREENLAQLKSLKIERKEGPIFKTHAECLSWLESVLPLLKFNNSHYSNFKHHSQFMYISTLSADFLMSHLNPMIGIVNQAIIELEMNPIENIVNEKPSKKSSSSVTWDNKPVGKITLSIISGIAVITIVWALAHYGNINLRN
jgi:hypothetical protein